MDVFKFAEKVKERAKLTLQQEGSHYPLMMCFTLDGLKLIPMQFANDNEKVRILSVIKSEMQKYHMWAYITINEGWMVTGIANEPVNLGIKPSQSPQRKEVLVVSVVTAKKKKMWSIPIIRENYNIMFGKENILATDNNCSVKGVFMDLLGQIH